MRKSDFTAFISTDYQDTIMPVIKEMDSIYASIGKENPNYVGWGNGYVLVPRQCSIYEKSYIELEQDITIPYNFSFSGMLAPDVKIEIIKGSGKGKDYLTEPYWCFGFDTFKCHATRDEVVQTTLDLREQLISYCINIGDNIKKY